MYLKLYVREIKLKLFSWDVLLNVINDCRNLKLKIKLKAYPIS